MRVKRGIVRHRRHKKIRKLAKGYRGMRHTTFVKANEAVMKAGRFAFRDRKAKKRTFRRLWIVRLNAALQERGLTYAPFIAAMNKSKISLDRKTLSELAINDPKAFDAVVALVGKKK